MRARARRIPRRPRWTTVGCVLDGAEDCRSRRMQDNRHVTCRRSALVQGGTVPSGPLPRPPSGRKRSSAMTPGGQFGALPWSPMRSRAARRREDQSDRPRDGRQMLAGEATGALEASWDRSCSWPLGSRRTAGGRRCWRPGKPGSQRSNPGYCEGRRGGSRGR